MNVGRVFLQHARNDGVMGDSFTEGRVSRPQGCTSSADHAGGLPENHHFGHQERATWQGRRSPAGVPIAKDV